MTTGNAYKKDIIPVFTPFSKKFWNAKKKTNSRYTLYLSYQHILHIKYYCSDYDFPYLIENVLDKIGLGLLMLYPLTNQNICESMLTNDTPSLMWIYKISQVDI